MHGDGEDGVREGEEEGEGESERKRSGCAEVGGDEDRRRHREGRGGDKMRERGERRGERE